MNLSFEAPLPAVMLMTGGFVGRFTLARVA